MLHDLGRKPIHFTDLEDRFGRDNAGVILRTLEKFEGIAESRVAKLSFEERLENVFQVMSENLLYQTRH